MSRDMPFPGPTTVATIQPQVSIPYLLLESALRLACTSTPAITTLTASDRNAVAYAATRLVPCYAAVSRALMHVKEALPFYAPKSFLDFGAGPGTATMAAGSVFALTADAFTLVEPSIAMQVKHNVWRATLGVTYATCILWLLSCA